MLWDGTALANALALYFALVYWGGGSKWHGAALLYQRQVGWETNCGSLGVRKENIIEKATGGLARLRHDVTYKHDICKQFSSFLGFTIQRNSKQTMTEWLLSQHFCTVASCLYALYMVI